MLIEMVKGEWLRGRRFVQCTATRQKDVRLEVALPRVRLADTGAQAAL